MYTHTHGRSLILWLILAALCSPIPILAQSPIPEAREKAFSEFREKEGQDWTIRWNENTDTPSMLTMGKTKPYGTDPVVAARTFLAGHASLFGMNPSLPDLEVHKTHSVPGAHHVMFQQTYDGLPVVGARYLVHMDETGRIDMANGDYFPAVRPANQQILSKAAAIQVARQDLDALSADVRSKKAETEARRVIYPKDNQFLYAWEVTIHNGAEALNWAYYIDAQTGTVLSKINQIVSCFKDDKEQSGPRAPVEPATSVGELAGTTKLLGTGRGVVNEINPAVSPRTWVDLPRLDSPLMGVLWTLNGQFAKIMNEAGEEARSGNGVFNYSLTDPHFTEVNLYYQIDKFRTRFYEPFGTRPFSWIKAYANAPFNPLIGWYSFDTSGRLGTLHFIRDSPQEGFRNSGLDDAVIFHEYTHAFVHQINDNIFSQNGTEEGSISEGTADFMAQTFTGRPEIGTYVSASGLPLRNAANPDVPTYSIYKASYQDAHLGGEFWTAVLWDLRNATGMEHPDVVNNLVAHAVYRLDGSPTFLEFRDAILAEDRARHGGGHVGTITRVFANRGIGTTFSDPFSVSFSGPYCIQPNTNRYFAASIRGGALPYSNIYWYYRPVCVGQGVESCDSYSYAGQGASILFGQGQYRSFDLYVSARDASGQSRSSSARYIEVSPYCNSANSPDAGSKKMEDSESRSEISTFSLLSVAPNPSNGLSTIHFELPQQATVRVAVYDVLGRSVMTLSEIGWAAGRHTFPLDVQGLPAGTYFVKMTATSPGSQVVERAKTFSIVK